jgi:DNA-binding transcriptional MocR family regulator
LFILTSLLCNRGDYVICEEFSYNHAVESVFGMLGAKPIGVAMDNNGMVPEALEQVRELSGRAINCGRYRPHTPLF